MHSAIKFDFNKLRKCDEERFVKYYTIEDNGCWNWIRALDKDGFGKFFYNGEIHQASRFALQSTTFIEQPNLYIKHNCNNKKCVNPHHLQWSTKRNYIKKNNFTTKMTYGLTQQQIEMLRDLYINKCSTQKYLASKFNIDKRHVTVLLGNLIRK